MNSAKRVQESYLKSVGKHANDGNESSDDDFDPELWGEEATLDLFRCPLCAEVVTDATRVIICMDLFCTGCIQRYFLEGGHNSCPHCRIDLGPSPEVYLRFDQWSTERLVNLVEYFRLRRERDALRAGSKSKIESERGRLLPKSSSVILMRKQMSHAMTEGASPTPAEVSSQDGKPKSGKKNKRVGHGTSSG